MDFIKEDGSFIRIENDRLEGYLSDGTCLFSLRQYDPLPAFDNLTIGEYELYNLPGGNIALRRTTKECDDNV